MSQKLIRTLLHLAQVDGSVSGSELALIYKIAIEKRLPMFELEQLIRNPPQEKEELNKLTKEERFEYIYAIILMAKMDAKLDHRELELCQSYAESLGFEPQVIPELLEIIESDDQLSGNKEVLREAALKFLK
jgi:uncharacterized tellurite resistance protein B-like protein